jgi:CBS domain-containing protein
MTAENSRRLLIADVMLRRYLRLGEGHTLAEVMGFLTDPHFEKDGLPFLVVIAEDGSFAGILQPKEIFRHLVGDSGEGADDPSVIEQARSRLSTPVGKVMERDIPQLSPGLPLDEAFLRVHESPAECIAVTEEGRIVGLLTARILFEKASALSVGALSGGVIPSKQQARD